MFDCIVQEGKCAYGIIIVAIFWMTECLPLAVTAIMPVVLMTWLGVMDSREICKNYLKVRIDCFFLFKAMPLSSFSHLPVFSLIQTFVINFWFH